MLEKQLEKATTIEEQLEAGGIKAVTAICHRCNSVTIVVDPDIKDRACGNPGCDNILTY